MPANVNAAINSLTPQIKAISVSSENLQKKGSTKTVKLRSKSTSCLAPLFSENPNTDFKKRQVAQINAAITLQQKQNQELVNSLCEENGDLLPSLSDGQVKTLLSMLKDVQDSRLDLNALITELQKNYDNLLIKHAIAENTIDKMKFRTFTCEDCGQPPKMAAESADNVFDYSDGGSCAPTDDLDEDERLFPTSNSECTQQSPSSVIPCTSPLLLPLAENGVDQAHLPDLSLPNANNHHPSASMCSAPANGRLESDSDYFDFTPFTNGRQSLENVNADGDFFKLSLPDLRTDSGFHGSEVSDKSQTNLAKSVLNMSILEDEASDVNASSSNSSLTDTTRLNPNFATKHLPKKSKAHVSSQTTSENKVMSLHKKRDGTVFRRKSRTVNTDLIDDSGIVSGSATRNQVVGSFSETSRYGYVDNSSHMSKTSTPKHSRMYLKKTDDPHILSSGNSHGRNNPLVKIYCYSQKDTSESRKYWKKKKYQSRSHTSPLSHSEVKAVNSILDDLSHKAEKLRRRSLLVLRSLRSDLDEENL